MFYYFSPKSRRKVSESITEEKSQSPSQLSDERYVDIEATQSRIAKISSRASTFSPIQPPKSPLVKMKAKVTALGIHNFF